jgi:hypothetical protein
MPIERRDGAPLAFVRWAGECPGGGAHAWALPAPHIKTVCLKCGQEDQRHACLREIAHVALKAKGA